jgi:hypothetical protein
MLSYLRQVEKYTLNKLSKHIEIGHIGLLVVCLLGLLHQKCQLK